ncbi:MAG: RagB/SusD family nutrient uptake outer membrane protein [Cytophagales bacterium]|nr:RagB/SusD family nutrient uptake outer membrane protein [Cytophagales bacterium]
MRNELNLYVLIVALLSMLTGCDDDFLNTKPLNEVSEADVWTDEDLAEAAVTGIYQGLGDGGFDEQMLASLTDEAVFTHAGRGINTVTESRANSDNRGWVNATYDWDDMYRVIRAANIAISELREPQFENTTQAERLLGEALFLRAYYYHQLVRYYGGVPLVSEPLTLDSEFKIPRSTFEASVNFIISDCDEAFGLLDGKSPDPGRATAEAALALKSRILLYAASDLHDIPTASSKSSLIGGFSNPELIGYVSGDQNARWIAALNAAKAVLDLGGFGYELDLTGPVSFEEAKQNYINLSLSGNGGESEAIWSRQFIEDKGDSGTRMGLFNGPNGYHNWAGNAPLQNLIDDYEMMDGSAFDWDNPAHASAPYENRDPRFYATVLYDGADWKPRPSDVTLRDPANQIQTGQYEIIDESGAKVIHFGLDTRQGPIEDWNGTRSGYYMRKFIDPNPSIIDQTDRQEVPWVFFRYTEAIFNYVEALLETGGSEEEARSWLNRIRYRVGMPAIGASGPALMEKYRQERRIEMAFEEQRYHDARRWMIAPETIGQKARIIEISGTLKPGSMVTRYAFDLSDYDYTYTPTELDPGIENRMWLDKSYYVPISRSELNANTTLIQNPGYQ